MHDLEYAEVITPPIPHDTVAHRFFRRAFGIFIAFAVLLTLVLVGETLWRARENLQHELSIYQRSFEKSLASALWSMDSEKLESIVRGIVQIPDIKGVRVFDYRTGELLIESGVFPPAGDHDSYSLVHRFNVIHDEGYGKEVVAKAEFHSSLAQLLERAQGQILLIVVLATLKTLAFWWIFLFVGQRLLGRPLTEITQAIATTDSPRSLPLSAATEQAIAGTEIALLRDAYEAMTQRMLAGQSELEQANTALEQRVRERTLELQDANAKLETLAHTDFLTGLANRRQFIALAGTEIARTRRSGRPLSLLVCDMDKFKSINDEYGHLAGDQTICQVARHLREAVREIDVVGRFGGDEFVVLLPEIPLEEARRVAERLRAGVAAMPVTLADGRQLTITLSIGLTTLQPGDVALEDLFHRADTGLYAAKNGGRNCVVEPA